MKTAITSRSLTNSESSHLVADPPPADGRLKISSPREIVIAPGARELDPRKWVRRDRRSTLALSVFVPVALIALWQLAAERGWIDVRFIPAPTEIFTAWKDMISEGEYWPHVRASVGRLVYGFLFGAGAGLAVGLLIGRLRRVRAALEPTIMALYTVPKLAILPLLLLLYGIGETPKRLLIAITTFFIVLINTSGALEKVPEGHLEAARSFGLGRLATARHITIPAALPQIFVGLRIASGVAVLALVGAEFVAANSGLGYLVWNSWSIGVPTRMYIGVVSIALLGVLTNTVLRFLQRIATPWDR